MQIRLGLFLFVCLAAGCDPTEKTSNHNFDTRSFFRQEAQRLKDAQTGMIKTMMYNDQSRQLVLKGPVNWENELASFLAINLADESFTADTTRRGDELIITYSGTDDKKELKSAVLTLAGSRVASIRFELYTRNSLYTNRKLMEYLPLNGYRIQGVQDVKLLNGSDYSVNASWTN